MILDFDVFGIWCSNAGGVHLIYRSPNQIFKAANAVFCKIGGGASEEVIIQIIRTKCMPVLLYGLEACPLRKSDINLLNFVVNRFFMKLFRTSNIDIVNYCRAEFKFELPGTVTEQRTSQFRDKYRSCDNLYCKLLCVWWWSVHCIIIV